MSEQAPPAAAAAARPRPWRGALLAGAGPFLSVALALAVGALFILAIGERPGEIYALMLRESLGTGYGLGQTLFRATPLIFTGLAVALGAPFWFDVVGKLINLRTSGPPPQKAEGKG